MYKCVIVVYNKAVGFEIEATSVLIFFICSRFGVQIVGTTDRMQAFVQMKCKSILNFKICCIIKL